MSNGNLYFLYLCNASPCHSSCANTRLYSIAVGLPCVMIVCATANSIARSGVADTMTTGASRISAPLPDSVSSDTPLYTVLSLMYFMIARSVVVPISKQKPRGINSPWLRHTAQLPMISSGLNSPSLSMNACAIANAIAVSSVHSPLSIS